MTTWIDGSFIYSQQEAWVSTMRSYRNGTLKWMDGAEGMPPYNVERVPLFNSPIPHVLRRLSPERMFGEFLFTLILAVPSPLRSFQSWAIRGRIKTPPS